MILHDTFMLDDLLGYYHSGEDKKMVGWEVPIGAAIAFAAGAIATGWAQSRIGAAGAGAIAEKPETAGSIIIIDALPETLVILGFVIASMIILMVK
jgi:V/A-type H+-transporting ATPase subunit K